MNHIFYNQYYEAQPSPQAKITSSNQEACSDNHSKIEGDSKITHGFAEVAVWVAETHAIDGGAGGWNLYQMIENALMDIH